MSVKGTSPEGREVGRRKGGFCSPAERPPSLSFILVRASSARRDPLMHRTGVRRRCTPRDHWKSPLSGLVRPWKGSPRTVTRSHVQSHSRSISRPAQASTALPTSPTLHACPGNIVSRHPTRRPGVPSRPVLRTFPDPPSPEPTYPHIHLSQGSRPSRSLVPGPGNDSTTLTAPFVSGSRGVHSPEDLCDSETTLCLLVGTTQVLSVSEPTRGGPMSRVGDRPPP